MAKMTKALRKTILENVVKATTLPEERDAIMKAASRVAFEFVKSELTEGFVAMSDGHPKAWFQQVSSVSLRVGDVPLPSLLRPEDSHNHWWTLCFESVSVPANFYVDADRVAEKLAPLVKQAGAWNSRYRELTVELSNFLLSHSTTEKVIAAMPELEKHIPAEERAYPVAVSPVKLANSLAKLGFDKTLALPA